MSHVFIVDTNQQPLTPVHSGRARLLLEQGKAAVWRRYPFTLILKRAVPEPEARPLRLKIDPGSKTTGLALVDDTSGKVVFAAELSHRGQQIRAALASRRAVRRSRRQRHTRYRAPRFQNRRRRAGWLPPSFESRISTIVTWVKRLRHLTPITAISLELVRFDLHRLKRGGFRKPTLYENQLKDIPMNERLTPRELREWCAEHVDRPGRTVFALTGDDLAPRYDPPDYWGRLLTHNDSIRENTIITRVDAALERYDRV